MMFGRLAHPAVVGALLLLGADGALAQRQSAAVLGTIERGQWQLKERDGATRRLCFAAPASFIQLHHGNVPCEHFVVAEDQRSATVRYACPGHGHGRTTILVETPKLVRIETQGVFDGAPFEQEYEGRRIGACS